MSLLVNILDLGWWYSGFTYCLIIVAGYIATCEHHSDPTATQLKLFKAGIDWCSLGVSLPDPE